MKVELLLKSKTSHTVGDFARLGWPCLSLKLGRLKLFESRPGL